MACRTNEPVTPKRDPLKRRFFPADANRQAAAHRVLGYAVADQLLNGGMDLRSAHRPALVGQHLDDSLDEPGTWAGYEIDGRKRLLPAFESIPLGHLGVEQVRAWMDEQAEAVEAGEIAPKTVNNALDAGRLPERGARGRSDRGQPASRGSLSCDRPPARLRLRPGGIFA